MSFHYYVDPEINCVFIRHLNEFEVGDGAASVNLLLADADHRPGINILRDLTRISFSKEVAERSFSAQVRQGARVHEQQLGHCLLAWVHGSAADFAVGHRWSASTRPTRTFTRRPFRAIGPARAWLGIPEDYVIKYPGED
jgi:hypothetical protein